MRCGDAQMCATESCAYAGHLGLGKLIAFYDDNGITIAGTSMSTAAFITLMHLSTQRVMCPDFAGCTKR